jgi:ribosomal protein L7/L12
MKRRKWGWWAGPIRLSGGARLEGDRSAGQSLPSTLDPKDKAEIEAMVTRKATIRAIRRVRELTGLRLIDAAKLVDSLQP